MAPEDFVDVVFCSVTLGDVIQQQLIECLDEPIQDPLRKLTTQPGHLRRLLPLHRCIRKMSTQWPILKEITTLIIEVPILRLRVTGRSQCVRQITQMYALRID